MENILSMIIIIGGLFGGIFLSRSCNEKWDKNIKVMHDKCDSVCGEHPVETFNGSECYCRPMIIRKATAASAGVDK